MFTITGQLQFVQLSPRYLIEQGLLWRLAMYLWAADNQFGLKQAHGTEIAILALKQAVDFYHNQDTPVYMCFLDAKKGI